MIRPSFLFPLTQFLFIYFYFRSSVCLYSHGRARRRNLIYAFTQRWKIKWIVHWRHLRSFLCRILVNRKAEANKKGAEPKGIFCFFPIVFILAESDQTEKKERENKPWKTRRFRRKILLFILRSFLSVHFPLLFRFLSSHATRPQRTKRRPRGNQKVNYPQRIILPNLVCVQYCVVWWHSCMPSSLFNTQTVWRQSYWIGEFRVMNSPS